MKKIFVLFIIIVTSYSIYAQNAILQKLPSGKVPTIDGSAETLWDTIPSHLISKPILNEVPTLSANWKSVWNDTAIFILVTVTDNFHCDTSCSHQ